MVPKGIFRSRPPRGGDDDDTVEIKSDVIADLDES